jgi:hypothetical protein
MLFKKIIISIAFMFLLSALYLYADTIPGGNVYGIWDVANSPYYITGNITIPTDSTLTIEPGVLVDFLGDYLFTVNGFLNALGTESDSIIFTADTTSTIWAGLYFTNAPDSSHLEYCVLENALDVMFPLVGCYNSNPVISHCLLRNSRSYSESGGVAIHNCSPAISYCTISGNDGTYGGGIGCYGGSTPSISHCTIIDNENSGTYAGGVLIESGSHPVFDGCIISGNNAMCGGGIAILGGSSCTITDCWINADSAYGTGEGRNGGGVYINSSGGIVDISNTIIDDCSSSDSGGCIYVQNASTVSITRSIIDGNYSYGDGGVLSFINCDSLYIDHCDVVNNEGYLIASGIMLDGATNLVLSNCIFRNQRFDDIWFKNYSSASVTYSDFYDCGTGAPFTGNPPAGLGEFEQTNYNGDSCDIYYNIFLDPLFEDFPNGNYHLTNSSPCIDAGDPAFPYDPDSTITDMGAHYFNQSGISEDISAIDSPILELCGGNPLSFSRIRFTLPSTCKVTLSIYDLTGRRISKLADGNYGEGTHEVSFNANKLSQGIYFCVMEVDGIYLKQKFIVLK